jgi:hypothetical protein
MVAVSTVIVLLVLVCAGLIYRFRNRAAFATGVAITLALWVATFVGPPSYSNALYAVLGLIGSGAFGLLGFAVWWRWRHRDAGQAWFWLMGGALAAAPACALGAYSLLAGGA